MSIYLAVPLVVVAIPVAGVLFFAWMFTPSSVFIVPGLILLLVGGIAAASCAIAYDGQVPTWVQIVGGAGAGLCALGIPAFVTEDEW